MVQQEDSITGAVTRKSYDFLGEYPMLCLSTLQKSNSLGSITTYTATWDLISYGNKRILPYNSTEVIHNHITNTSEHFSRIIDNNGNITSSQTINRNGTNPELTTNVAYTGYNSYGNWGIPNKPLSITTTATYKTKDPVSTSIDYVYNLNGTISSEKRFTGTPKETTITYTYYTSGNLHTTTLSAQGLPSRSTSYEYDSKGRFVTTIEEPDGKESLSVTDPGTGNTISFTGIDNLTTTYEYDGLGRLSKTTTPLGHDILSTIAWDNTSSDIPSVYYSTVTAPGRPSLTEYYDSFGRTLRTSGDAFGGTVFVDREYNPEGTVKKVSWPYRSGDNKRWAGYSYDDYQRLTEENNNSLITQYSYNVNAITVTYPDQKTKIALLNSLNQPVQITENDNSQIIYDYNSFGQICSITTLGNLVAFFYDQYGLRDSIYNSNSGGVKLSYNAFRELVTQIDANGLETEVQYDVLGRLTTKTTPEGTISYNYVGTGNGVRQISSVTGPGGVSEGYTYDGYGRLTQFSRTIQNEINLNYQYLYDQYGNNTNVTYPSAMRIENVYDSYGNLIEIKQENGTLIWQLNSLRATGNPAQYTLGPNSLTRTFGYDSCEQLSNITTGLWQQSYSFNPSTGNLNSRSYKNVNSQDELTESFQYDLMNRLTSSQVNGLQQYSVTYDQTGNILTKSDAGNYSYDPMKVNALVTLENNPGTISPDMQSITYNSLNKPLLISEGDYSNGFLYGTDGQRFRSELFRNDTLIKSRYYGPGYEKTVTADSTWENYYIVSPYGLAAVIVKESGAATTYYAETDHLGSLIGLMNSNGTHAERFSFDAWGKRRNPADWSYSNVPEPILTERGFTGHEHMDLFGLINMNGRIYDPVTARLLNTDPVIQNPFYSQNLNGYSYCINNPLRYKDPQGYVIRRPEEITWIDFSQVYASAERLKQGARHDDQFAYSYSAGMYFDSEGNVIPEREVMSSMTSDNFAFQITDPINLKLDISSKGFYLCFGSMTPQERIGEVGNVEFEATFSFIYTLQFVPYSSSVAQGGGGVDGMDIANYIVSNSGTLVGGAQYGVNSMSNSQQWKYSYKASKYLKGKGINVQTRVIKHGANGVLKNASRKITYVGGVLAVADVAIDGELRASHLLNAGMVGVSAIPVAGWIIGGSYFVADMITLGVSGQSIGQHLDNAVGNPLVDDIYNW